MRAVYSPPQDEPRRGQRLLGLGVLLLFFGAAVFVVDADKLPTSTSRLDPDCPPIPSLSGGYCYDLATGGGRPLGMNRPLQAVSAPMARPCFPSRPTDSAGDRGRPWYVMTDYPAGCVTAAPRP
jgi:hypothetical protein